MSLLPKFERFQSVGSVAKVRIIHQPFGERGKKHLEVRAKRLARREGKARL